MKKYFLILILVFSCLNVVLATDAEIGGVVNPIGIKPRVNSASVATNVTVTQISDLIVLDSKSDATSTLTTTLYDQYGEEVYTNVTTTSTGIIDVIDTSDLESGVYTIVLEDNSGAYNQENIVL